VIVNAFAVTVLAAVATFTLVAPLLLSTMFPLLEPAVAVAATRTWTVVLLMVPEEPTVTVPLNVLLSVDTSKPEGGVTKIPAVMFAPETENEVEAEAVPYVVGTSEIVPLVLMVGVAAGAKSTPRKT